MIFSFSGRASAVLIFLFTVSLNFNANKEHRTSKDFLQYLIFIFDKTKIKIDLNNMLSLFASIVCLKKLILLYINKYNLLQEL